MAAVIKIDLKNTPDKYLMLDYFFQIITHLEHKLY